jgi:NTE family protein
MTGVEGAMRGGAWRILAPALLVLAVLALPGCATRPVNPPLAQADERAGYRFETRRAMLRDPENLVVLAFSGGGTRAAAFSFGVLEFLRDATVINRDGAAVRLLDEVAVITGVSGGSFTALAYGLHGERLFDEYERRFLKRNVQGTLASRALNPTWWPRLFSAGWDRSELAAELYDEILFEGATFGDLRDRPGPLVLASATDLSSGARFVFHQHTFDLICSDLSAVRLSRAAAASSAVPVLLSPVTLNNYGGTCNRRRPAWVERFMGEADPPRPAARAIRALRAQEAFADGTARPFLHLVDGGVSDNLGMRGVLDVLELMEALQGQGADPLLERVRRIVVIVVNSLSVPPNDWDRRARAPGAVDVLLRSAGVPIDHHSYEAVELLKDTAARWRTLRAIAARDPALVQPLEGLAYSPKVPQAELYAIDVSFSALDDPAEFDYLNSLPTSFTLPPEAVDRLRAAAGRILRASPEFQRLLRDSGANLGRAPPRPATDAPRAVQ